MVYLVDSAPLSLSTIIHGSCATPKENLAPIISLSLNAAVQRKRLAEKPMFDVATATRGKVKFDDAANDKQYALQELKTNRTN